MEINQKTYAKLCGAEIVSKLCVVFIGQGCNGLDLYNQFAIANEVGNIVVLDFFTFVQNAQSRFFLERNRSRQQFTAKTVLIDVFQKANTNDTMYLHERTANRVRFVAV